MGLGKQIITINWTLLICLHRNINDTTYARSVSVEVPGWRDTSLRDSASIWLSERSTEGKSGLDKCEVKFFDEVNNAERSDAMFPG